MSEEAPHVMILRKNLMYLKEHLEVGDALDHLYQEGVFTQSEYNRCKEDRLKEGRALLELLRMKGEEAYKSLCVFLDKSQPHVKETLDKTSSDEGISSLAFVSKLTVEKEHRKILDEKRVLEEKLKLIEEENEKNITDVHQMKDLLNDRESEIDKIRKEKDELGKIMTEMITVKDKEAEKSRMEKDKLTQVLTLKDTEIERQKKVLAESNEMFPEIKVFLDFQERGVPIYNLVAGQEQMINYRLLSCPVMSLNKERVYSEIHVAGEGDQKLRNTQRSETGRSDQFTQFRGTCSVPLPIGHFPSDDTVAHYWETESRLQRKKRMWNLWSYNRSLSESCALLETGVVGEKSLDSGNWVSEHGSSSWSVQVFECDEHQGFCTRIRGSGVQSCQSTIKFSTTGTLEWKMGTVLDVGRGKLAFIDVIEEKVLEKLDIAFDDTLYPAFGVVPQTTWSVFSHSDINMSLRSGKDITITDKKKDLIIEALSSCKCVK